MDGLSGVASGMAVISLSLQLVQSINQIRNKIHQIRGAAAEVERLVRLPDLLSTLLDDVRQIMEYQSSRSADAIPMPSMTIFDCLKGCERQIEPLAKMIREYGRYETNLDSRITKLRKNAKIGLKAKDIAGFEGRVQQDFNRLSTALTLNNIRQYVDSFFAYAFLTLPTVLTHVGCMPSIYSCIGRQLLRRGACIPTLASEQLIKQRMYRVLT
jgi:hypothetical protein